MNISEDKISFHYETDFILEDEAHYRVWIADVVRSECCNHGDLSFIFCNDTYLLGINQQYLHHDTYTDIVTFDYTEGQTISGDVFISVQRVKENAQKFNQSFGEELRRVMAHGVLHMLGYTDKSEEDSSAMRIKESEKMMMFHVEQ